VVRTEVFRMYYPTSTAYMATYPAGWASWHSPFDWECALGFLRATREQSHRCAFPPVQDEQAGAAVIVVTEERPLMVLSKDCYWIAET